MIDYGISESNIWQTIKWVKEVLIKSGTFALPGKNKFLKNDFEYKIIMIDATETLIERPKKQKNYYSGKKKKHTIKNTF